MQHSASLSRVSLAHAGSLARRDRAQQPFPGILGTVSISHHRQAGGTADGLGTAQVPLAALSLTGIAGKRGANPAFLGCHCHWSSSRHRGAHFSQRFHNLKLQTGCFLHPLVQSECCSAGRYISWPTARFSASSDHGGVFVPRCDDHCSACEGSSGNCLKCKEGFSLLGGSCVTNETCTNGE